MIYVSHHKKISTLKKKNKIRREGLFVNAQCFVSIIHLSEDSLVIRGPNNVFLFFHDLQISGKLQTFEINHLKFSVEQYFLLSMFSILPS